MGMKRISFWGRWLLGVALTVLAAGLPAEAAPLSLEDYLTLVAGRNLALSLMGRLPWLKAPLASRTLGFVTDLCRP